MKNVLFPYTTLTGDIRLTLRGGGLDGGGWPKSPYTTDMALVQLHDLDKQDWRVAAFDVEVTVPTEEVRRLKDPDDVRVLAVVECPRALHRSTVELCRADGAGRWAGALELCRDNLAGKVTIHSLVVGRAQDTANRYLGVSDPWSVYVDEPDVPPVTGTMRVRWVDFDEPADGLGFLNTFAEQPFYTDLDAPQPTLFLNASRKKFDGLSLLLGDRKRNAAEKSLHNAERLSLARTVWMAMFQTAVASIRREDGEPPDWPIDDWKRNVLRKMLPRMFPGLGDADRLEAAAEARASAERAGQLSSLAQVTIDSLLRVPRLLRLTLDHLRGHASAD